MLDSSVIGRMVQPIPCIHYTPGIGTVIITLLGWNICFGTFFPALCTILSPRLPALVVLLISFYTFV